MERRCVELEACEVGAADPQVAEEIPEMRLPRIVCDLEQGRRRVARQGDGVTGAGPCRLYS